MNPKIFWGVLLVIPFALFILFCPVIPFAIVCAIASALAIREFFFLTMPGAPGWRWMIAACLGMVIVMMPAVGLPILAPTILGASLAVFAAIFMFTESDNRKALDATVFSFAGLSYGALLASFLPLLRDAQAVTRTNWVFLLFLAVWMNDAGAFFVGRKYGKRKLLERVSPAKTIEGSIGGLVAGVLGVFIFNLFAKTMTGWECLVLGLILGVTGPVGDLVESMIKRAVGVKDSGVFIPGHGGVLDRIDSIIFAAPFLYLFVYLRFLHSAVVR